MAKAHNQFDAWEKGDVCMIPSYASPSKPWKTAVFLEMSDDGLPIVMEGDQPAGKEWDGKIIPLPRLFRPEMVRPMSPLELDVYTTGWPRSEVLALQSKTERMNKSFETT